MKNFFLFLALAAIALFTGCATHYKEQIEAWKSVESERSKEGAAKYSAIQAIAGVGASDSTKQVALQAWQAVAMVEQMATGRARSDVPQAPPSALDRGLQALSILAPVAGQVWQASYAKNVAVNASNNAAAVAINEATARTAQLGVVRDTGIGVATATGGGYAGALQAALARPTYQITTTGNNNTVAGRDATTTTNTVQCPQTTTAQSGSAGNGSGAPGAAGGSAAPVDAKPASNCVAGK